MTKLLLPLVLWIVLAADRGTLADVSGTNPDVGSCFCPNINNLLVRDAPCGNVINTIGINQCYKYAGSSAICTLDIEYEFFLIDLAGQPGWVVGNYINLEPTSYCSEFPCGAPSPGLASQIIGGRDAVRNAYPWQLVIEQFDGSQWNLICGAALIDANWAITAAHCVESFTKPLRIIAGVYDRNEPIDVARQVRNVNSQHIILNPEYNSTTLENDIAILSLPSPYDLSTASIRTICLPPSSSTEYYESPSCQLTGWGITSVNSTTLPTVLQRTGIDVIKPGNCIYILNELVPRSRVCTFDQASRSVTPCEGDMGGPLSCAVNTRYQLAAVGSYPAPPNCNPRRPQMYTNVPFFLDWILLETGLTL
jgi:hypothetical protein